MRSGLTPLERAEEQQEWWREHGAGSGMTPACEDLATPSPPLLRPAPSWVGGRPMPSLHLSAASRIWGLI